MLKFKRVDVNTIDCFHDYFDEVAGELRKVSGKWVLYYLATDFFLTSECLRQIADKLDELNKAG